MLGTALPIDLAATLLILCCSGKRQTANGS